MDDICAFIIPRKSVANEILFMDMYESMEHQIVSKNIKSTQILFLEKINLIKAIYPKSLNTFSIEKTAFFPFFLTRNFNIDKSQNSIDSFLSKICKKVPKITNKVCLSNRCVLNALIKYNFFLCYTEPLNGDELLVRNALWCDPNNMVKLKDLFGYYSIGNEGDNIYPTSDTQKDVSKPIRGEFCFDPYDLNEDIPESSPDYPLRQLLKENNCDEDQQNFIFTEYMLNAYPSEVITCPQFAGFAAARGIYMKRIEKLFRVLSKNNTKMDFEKFLVVVICCDTSTKHENIAKKLRSDLLFDYYDWNKDRMLDYFEILCLIKAIRKKKFESLDVDSITKDAYNLFRKLITVEDSAIENSKIPYDVFMNNLDIPELEGLTYLLRFPTPYLEKSNYYSQQLKMVRHKMSKRLGNEIEKGCSMLPCFILEQTTGCPQLLSTLDKISNSYCEMQRLLDNVKEQNNREIAATNVRLAFPMLSRQIHYYLQEIIYDVQSKNLTYPLRNPLFLTLLVAAIVLAYPHLINSSGGFLRNLFRYYIVHVPVVIAMVRLFKNSDQCMNPRRLSSLDSIILRKASKSKSDDSLINTDNSELKNKKIDSLSDPTSKKDSIGDGTSKSQKDKDSTKAKGLFGFSSKKEIVDNGTSKSKIDKDSKNEGVFFGSTSTKEFNIDSTKGEQYKSSSKITGMFFSSTKKEFYKEGSSKGVNEKDSEKADTLNDTGSKKSINGIVFENLKSGKKEYGSDLEDINGTYSKKGSEKGGKLNDSSYQNSKFGLINESSKSGQKEHASFIEDLQATKEHKNKIKTEISSGVSKVGTSENKMKTCPRKKIENKIKTEISSGVSKIDISENEKLTSSGKGSKDSVETNYKNKLKGMFFSTSKKEINNENDSDSRHSFTFKSSKSENIKHESNCEETRIIYPYKDKDSNTQTKRKCKTTSVVEKSERLDIVDKTNKVKNKSESVGFSPVPYNENIKSTQDSSKTKICKNEVSDKVDKTKEDSKKCKSSTKLENKAVEKRNFEPCCRKKLKCSKSDGGIFNWFSNKTHNNSEISNKSSCQSNLDKAKTEKYSKSTNNLDVSENLDRKNCKKSENKSTFWKMSETPDYFEEVENIWCKRISSNESLNSIVEINVDVGPDKSSPQQSKMQTDSLIITGYEDNRLIKTNKYCIAGVATEYNTDVDDDETEEDCKLCSKH